MQMMICNDSNKVEYASTPTKHEVISISLTDLHRMNRSRDQLVHSAFGIGMCQ